MDTKGKLNSLEESLYQQGGTPERKTARTTRQQKQEVPSSWTSPQSKKKKVPFSFIFFLTSLIFFVIAISIAAVFFITGGRTVSPNNLTVTSEIPQAVASGETTTLRFSVRNANPVPLQAVRATITFPEGTKQGDAPQVPLTRVTKDLGSLAVGEEKNIVLSAIFFGEENDQKDITFSVEYRGKDSSAVIVKDTTEHLRISSAPVSVVIDAPQQVSAGDSFTTTVTIRSNSSEDIQNLFLLVRYPFGFTVEKTIPSGSFENTVWNIGTLGTGETKKIVIEGSLQNVNQKEQTISFTLGTGLNQAGETLKTIFAKKQAQLTVADAALALSVSLSGVSTSSVVVRPGQEVQGRITYQNNLDTNLFDVAVVLSLSGTALDLDRVQQQQGFYRSSDTSIVFNRDTNVEFKKLAPGARGSIVFKVPIQSTSALGTVRNPEVTITGSVVARQVNAANVPSKIVQTFRRSLQVRTELNPSETIERTVGAFVNTGPWPLRANIPSTFTVRIRVENTTNTLANTEVSVEFPSYVTYTGQHSPQGESVSYDDASKKLRWVIGDLPAHTARSISIQVSVLPSLSQVGKPITIVKNIIADGFDRFVKETVSATLEEQTSKNVTDPAYSSEKGVVAQ